jgi:DNA polymerase III epsilon subunit-like protein
MDPEGKIPKYNLQYLRYFLRIEIEANAHDALGDILVLEKLFERLFVKMSKSIGPAAVENRMMEISSKPVLLSRMFFGKHKGEHFKNIPVDYLQWLSGKDDLDEDMRFTVGHYLK